MKIVDLNVLLYAINADDPNHQAVCSWWEDALNGEEPIGLAWIVLLGFLRISTRSSVFPNPLTPSQALERIQRWLDASPTRIVHEGDEHFRILDRLIRDCGTAGNLTTDVHLAAIAIHHGATLASCDRDFQRFNQLRWENPLRS